jgi:hypothetical protein
MLSKDFWINEENKVIKQGKDCLRQHLGETGAQQFLLIYHLRRLEEAKGKDYTKWRQDNPPEEDPMMQELLGEEQCEHNLVYATA